MQMTTGST